MKRKIVFGFFILAILSLILLSGCGTNKCARITEYDTLARKSVLVGCEPTIKYACEQSGGEYSTGGGVWGSGLRHCICSDGSSSSSGKCGLTDEQYNGMCRVNGNVCVT